MMPTSAGPEQNGWVQYEINHKKYWLLAKWLCMTIHILAPSQLVVENNHPHYVPKYWPLAK